MRVSLYAPRPIDTDKARNYWKANLDLLLDVTNKEDFVTGEQIQRGFSTDAQAHVIYGRNEPALQHYHRTLKMSLGLPEFD
jgi:hypothetical protein